MKKTILLFALATTVLFGCKDGEKKEVVSEEIVEVDAPVIDMHNSRTSLDWAGVYEGTTPCADCEGIKTVLELGDNGNYSISQTYLGKQDDNESYDETGSFTWDDAGSKITLKMQDRTLMFRVGENQVTMLDSDGNLISDELAEYYVLKKKID